jgi:hypothetical protein
VRALFAGLVDFNLHIPSNALIFLILAEGDQSALHTNGCRSA